MCFYIHWTCKTPRTAKKDIKCWKILDSKRQAIFYNLYYAPGKLYEVEMYKLVDSVHQGFHSLTAKHFSRKYSKDLFNDNINTLLLLEAIIPKGATYYKNPRKGEYVSDKLIVK